MTKHYNKDDDLRTKAHTLIPGGAHTYSKGDDQFPSNAPGFITRGKGAYVWDTDGNKFLDWGMGLRSVCIGHAHPEILNAVSKQLELGVNFTRPSPLEAQLAERIIDLIPSAEMVKFGKNGSDATSAAVRLARAATGKKVILRCLDQPFFSVDDWFIGDTVMNAGIPDQLKTITQNFRYNDIVSLEQSLIENDGDVAAIILEPASTMEPDPDFLHDVRVLATKHNVVLIFDEIISGFRWDLKGAQNYYNVTPDLTTIGKAMANGFSLSALCGKRELMELGGIFGDHERVFLMSSTNGAETHSLAASMKTIEILENTKVIHENWDKGLTLMNEFNRLASNHGVNQFCKAKGIAISPFLEFIDEQQKPDFWLRTYFLQEMLKENILIPYISIAASHTSSEIKKTITAFDTVLSKISLAKTAGNIQQLVEGDRVKPVFRNKN